MVQTQTLNMTALPSDLLILIMQNLTVGQLCTLARTCRILNALVYEFGWPNYLRANARPSYSLSVARSQWDALSQVRYDTLADRAWARPNFTAHPLSHPWPGKQQPVIAVSSTRLLVAAESTIYSYIFTAILLHDHAPGIHLEAAFTLNANHSGRRSDITGITFIPDGGLDRTLYIGFDDGVLERVFLPSVSKHRPVMERSSHNTPHFNGGDTIESISSVGTNVLSLSTSGRASFFNTTNSPASSFVDLEKRSWSSFLSANSSYAAFGTSSTMPLVVHSITESALSSTPSAVLYSNAKHVSENRSSAVYGITGIPSSGPWGGSDQILVSGWYDGIVRVHDLRSSSRRHDLTSSAGPASLLPVLSLQDVWSFEPIYAVSCGGGSSSHIAAGSARHSVVAFWDVRSPKKGWSVHAPGNDSSPVYSVHLESSRLFGATQSRPFVYDFGPGVTHDTYPRLPVAAAGRYDGLKRKKGMDDIGYYVTKYRHSRSTS